MKKVSLYIPCYNAEKTIGECLNSVINQSYKIDEILVIDDGSEDKSIEVTERYPVRVIMHRKNKGLAAARNTAFKEARNEFVASLDADCVASTGWLETAMGCFINEDIAGVGGKLSERFVLNIADKWRSVHMTQQHGHEFVENPPYLYGNNAVFRRGYIKAAGFYNEKFKTNYEDIDLSLRIYKSGLKLIYNPEAKVEHIRKDTVKSALSTYWRWIYNRYPSLNDANSTFPSMPTYLKDVIYYAAIIKRLSQKDFQEKNYSLLLLDFIFIFYYPWLQLREYLKRK